MKINPFRVSCGESLSTMMHIDQNKAKNVLNDPDVQRRRPWRNVGESLYYGVLNAPVLLANMLYDASVYHIDLMNTCKDVELEELLTKYRSVLSDARNEADTYRDALSNFEYDKDCNVVAPHVLLSTSSVLAELTQLIRANTYYPNYENISAYEHVTTASLKYAGCLLLSDICSWQTLFELQRVITEYYVDSDDCYKVDMLDDSYNDYYFDDPYDEFYVYRYQPLLLVSLEQSMFVCVQLLQRCLEDAHKHDLDDVYHSLKDDLEAGYVCSLLEESIQDMLDPLDRKEVINNGR